jgi:hypothetical protein
VTVSATPNPCYSFVNWTENGVVVSTSSNYTFTANTSHDFVANFSPTIYSISASSFGGGSASGDGQVNCGSSATVTATANAGYQFVDWTENGSIVSASPSYTFTPTDSGILIANFLPITYAVNTSSFPLGGGSIGGGGIVNSGSNVVVTATANSGYTFLNWTKGGTVVSTTSNFTFTVTGNQFLVANFVPNIPILGFNSPPWSSNIFNLMLFGPIESNYDVDFSTDLFTWLPLTNFTSTNSPFYFTVPAATNANQGFFRAKMQ